MTTYTGRQIFDGLKQTRALMERERAEWQRVAQGLQSSVGGLPRQIDAAWAYLGEVVVPSLAGTVLDDAAAKLALPHISARNVAALREKDQVVNAARLQASDADPFYVEREQRTNAAQIWLAEVEDALVPLNVSVGSLRKEPGFEDLVAAGYGSDAYAFKFWQTSYYRHWQLGDVIVERHGARLKAEDFAGIRKKYFAEQEALGTLATARAEQRAVLASIKAAADARAHAAHALATPDARALAWVRGRVREHLSALPPDEMTKLLQLVPAWRVAGTRILGLLAKQAYLEEMQRQVIKPFDDEAHAALLEIDARIMKMARPKKWAERVDEVTYQKRIGRRRIDKWSSRRTQLDGARRSVESFDRYDRYDPTVDFLWWSVMTDGRHQMPFTARDDGSAVLWGSSDDARFAAADAATRTRDQDGTRERDFS